MNDLQGGFLVPPPGEFRDRVKESILHHFVVNQLMIPAIDQGSGADKKFQFFFHLLAEVPESFIMGMPYVGEDPDRGPDDGFQFFHFTRERDPCFKQSQVILRFHLPDRKRNTDLGIIAFRTPDNLFILTHQME